MATDGNILSLLTHVNSEEFYSNLKQFYLKFSVTFIRLGIGSLMLPPRGPGHISKAPI